MALNSLTKLSNEIAENAKIVTDYLESKCLAAPSFDVDGLDEYPIPPTEEVPFKARLKLISLTKEMHDLALGPKEGLRFLAWDVRRSCFVEERHLLIDVEPYSLSIPYHS